MNNQINLYINIKKTMKRINQNLHIFNHNLYILSSKEMLYWKDVSILSHNITLIKKCEKYTVSNYLI
jgi:hypothetical protein